MTQRKPYTDNQFRALDAAFRGSAYSLRLDSRRARTRAINDVLSAKLIYGGTDGGGLTATGLLAYVDMCERYDADSGCVAYQERAETARRALAASRSGDSDYQRTVTRAFASAPFRIEWRPYSSGGGIWKMLHQSNGAIIATGASPAGCVDNLSRAAEQMRGIVSGLPFKGQRGDA